MSDRSTSGNERAEEVAEHLDRLGKKTLRRDAIIAVGEARDCLEYFRQEGTANHLTELADRLKAGRSGAVGDAVYVFDEAIEAAEQASREIKEADGGTDGLPSCVRCGEPVPESEASPGPAGHVVHEECGSDD